MDPESNDNCAYKRHKGEGPVKKEAEIEVTKPWNLRNFWSHQKLEEERRILSELSGEYTALPTTEHKSASFRLLASRMVREQISLF